MSSNTFMDQFIARKGEPITYDGRDIYWTYHIPVRKGDEVVLRLRHFVRQPVQGIAIDCDNCTARIGGISGNAFQIWTDTAPETVPVQILRAKAGARLAVFNVWRGDQGQLMLYRLNNAAIDVRPGQADVVVLHCSDGYGPPDFDDLVVEVVRGPSA